MVRRGRALTIYRALEELIQYGLKKNLIKTWDVDYVRNDLLSILQLDEWKTVDIGESNDESPIRFLETIVDWAVENGRLNMNTVTYRDLLDTKIMGVFVARPSVIIETFYEHYRLNGAKVATNYFYELSKHSHYIRTDRIAKNEHWYSPTAYGDLEITINLSKPEKDPTTIAAEREMVKVAYPDCLLCKENVGYAGRLDHPARQSHRIIPVRLNNEQWFLQYSPYVYYNEHAIVFSGEHSPMKISKAGFERLLDFVNQFPHYFIGSNADLPIVGGSILSHDHFQGGNHEFPMAKAKMEETFTFENYEGIEVGIVRWPMSVIRLRGKDRQQIANLADMLTKQWKEYSDPDADIYAYSGQVPHNTVTPIVRKIDDYFEFDLVLRNNRTDEEHPYGIFHPHKEVHHIKKENIGLIEVMGLAVLPGRLKEELQKVGQYLLQVDGEERIYADEQTNKHAAWAVTIKRKYEDLNEKNIAAILRNEVGYVFAKVLEHAGVYKRTKEGQEAFRKFIRTMGDGGI
ncbi:UDP-glucose--hexose-1-phosphate uridylyltransferase [Bacillus sp. FJAT-50079]|uniref:UDP-glucose--hexose-1-phosphate uridylyltransferase n=1 Tax=Bacillus sp. FJAT-50079 TaxID=2833577 RepID=UPI001BC8E8D7|nr:UDP-glucose--hexose-1-phosphate uridylyltransferase [Bacillus sp. FJAT-50079]MBS4208268.1 UDP-glucose--hexose-1-phosphate uridylyltransferase [Bacillus sp. FJAT-50079]